MSVYRALISKQKCNKSCFFRIIRCWSCVLISRRYSQARAGRMCTLLRKNVCRLLKEHRERCLYLLPKTPASGVISKHSRESSCPVTSMKSAVSIWDGIIVRLSHLRDSPLRRYFMKYVPLSS